MGLNASNTHHMWLVPLWSMQRWFMVEFLRKIAYFSVDLIVEEEKFKFRRLLFQSYGNGNHMQVVF